MYYWFYLVFLSLFCYGMCLGEALPAGPTSIISSHSISSLGTILQVISLLTITGMPPLPIFFSKFVVVYSLLCSTPLNSYVSFTCVIFTACSFVMLLMYVRRICFLVLNSSVIF